MSFVAALLVFALFQPSPRAHAAGLSIAEFLSSAAGRYLLLATPEGANLFRTVVGFAPSGEAAQLEHEAALLRTRFEAPQLVRFRAELERRLAPATELSEAPHLSEPDRELLSELARRNLVLKSRSWHPPIAGELNSEPIEFLPESGGNFEAQRAIFTGTGVDTEVSVPADPAEPPFSERDNATPEQRRNAIQRIKDFEFEMRDCVENKPATAAKSSNLRYQLTQWGIDEAMTVTGSIIASGVDHIDWKNLPSDILFDSMSSLVGSRVITRPGGFRVRWFRFAVFGAGQAGVDATVYHFSPLKDTHGVDANHADLQRLEYNAAWNLAYSPISVGIYQLVSGLECLYPTGKVVAGTTAIRLGAAFGANVAYFKIRRKFYGIKENR